MDPGKPLSNRLMFMLFKTKQWLLLWNCSNGESFFGTFGTRSNKDTVNLVPRVSSLLYLYSGIQEAVRQSDWPFAILGCNSDLRWVNDLGMSKFDVKPHSLPIPTIICNLFPKFEEERAILFLKLR